MDRLYTHQSATPARILRSYSTSRPRALCAGGMSGAVHPNHEFLATVSATRLARPTTDLERVTSFYLEDLGLTRLGSFSDLEGCHDAVSVGIPGATWHLEFTRSECPPTPTPEDLLVLYMPRLAVARVSDHLADLGHLAVRLPATSPLALLGGATAFLDPDGYALALCPEGMHGPTE